MTHDFLPFALPDVGEAEIQAMAAAVRSGWLSSGPKVKEFESAFSDVMGDGIEAVSLNSATAGLHLALEALGVGPGDEVLVPTWTFTATAEVVRLLGATPVLVDVDRHTLNIDLVDAASKVTSATCGVIPVHFAGLPVDPRAIADFKTRYGLWVVEDAAHAFPASWSGKLVGTNQSEATVFSFYATKTMTTGEGGMLVTRNAELARRAKSMRLHGISRDAFDRYRSTKPSWHYDVVAAGYKYNLTDPAAAIGLVQLGRAIEMRDRRAHIATKYDEGLSNLGLDLPTWGGSEVEHAWHLYVIRVPAEFKRNEVIEALARMGIGTSVHFIPLHLQSFWRDFGKYSPQDFPVASAVFERTISLPIYSAMQSDQISRVIEGVQHALVR